MSEDNLIRGPGISSMGEIVRQQNNPTMHSGFMLHGAKSSVDQRKEPTRPAILTKNADLNFEDNQASHPGEKTPDVATEKMSG